MLYSLSLSPWGGVRVAHMQLDSQFTVMVFNGSWFSQVGGYYFFIFKLS